MARRWTQDDLAHRLGYDVTYVRKIEWGERRPSDAFRVRLADVFGVPVFSLPVSVPAARPNVVPDPGTPLIGRADEVAAVTTLFRAGARLVTLIGPPGIGKTRLAVALASALDNELPGGARFVALVGLTDPADVTAAIARALGVPLPGGGHELERLVDGMESQDVFLVLDNFEHVIEAAPLVAELLARVPALRILVTSRQALDLRLETQYTVQPLALPEGAIDPDRDTETGAVALFLARARKARPDFAINGANLAAVVHICTRLQGIPLAIELAAGTARFLTPTELLAQLGTGLDLPLGPRDAPAHQRTLRAAISWSFELLRPEERALMCRLAVFTAGCTMDAVAAVCRLGEEPTADLRSGLLGLAAKSLLQPVAGDGGGTRFVALDSVRGFALEGLRVSGDLEQLQDRHAAWFLHLAAVNDERLTGPDQAAALLELEADHANLRAAIRWSLEHDPTTALLLCGRLWRFWWIRGHLAEGRHWLADALASPGGDEAARAVALAGAGVLARTQGAYDASAELLEQAASLSRSTNNQPSLALALINLGHVAYDRGDYHRAWELFEECRAIYAALGDCRGVAHSLNCLGTVRLGHADFDGAVIWFEQALSTFRELGDDWSVAMVTTNLGWAADKQGRSVVARKLYERALVVYRALGDDRGVATMLVNLGIASRGANLDQVVGLFEEALLTFSRLGERRSVAECLEALAMARRGFDPAGAVLVLAAARSLRQRIGAPLGPEEQAAHTTDLDALRVTLGERVFDDACREGRLSPMDEVMSRALTRPDPT